MDNHSHLLINTGYWTLVILNIVTFPFDLSDMSWAHEWAFPFFFSFLMLYLGSNTPDLDLKGNEIHIIPKIFVRIIPKLAFINQKFDRIYRTWFVNPVQKRYNSFEHRGITHSLNGFLWIVLRFLPVMVFCSFIGLEIHVIYFYHEFLLFFFQQALSGIQGIIAIHSWDLTGLLIKFLLLGWFGYAFGYLGHLWEDTSTLQGLYWWYPDRKKTSGYIRTTTVNEVLGRYYFLLPVAALFYIYHTLVKAPLPSIIRFIIPFLAIASMFGVGLLFKSETRSVWLLVRDPCPNCKQPMILKKGHSPYWECSSCVDPEKPHKPFRIEALELDRDLSTEAEENKLMQEEGSKLVFKLITLSWLSLIAIVFFSPTFMWSLIAALLSIPAIYIGMNYHKTVYRRVKLRIVEQEIQKRKIRRF